ncbi:MAG: Holliday junction ATP-dependent DNA helicase RuvA [Verrucomicrobiae bacterium]|nr:Holliday junction ATP-dependent DNA helicase RuvA [Verrucomicrobiae bacterium]
MIAYLQGQLAAATPTHVIVDCHGVGYSVFIPVSSFSKLPAVGSVVKLITYHHVIAQDGTQQLFGFATEEERDMFLLLISISGIGPKLGCNILSSASVTGLRTAIATGDTKTLSSLRGIGKKTAERLVLELREKVGSGTEAVPAPPANPREADAAAALVSLGYKPADAQSAVTVAGKSLGTSASVEELVRAALRGR